MPMTLVVPGNRDSKIEKAHVFPLKARRQTFAAGSWKQGPDCTEPFYSTTNFPLLLHEDITLSKFYIMILSLNCQLLHTAVLCTTR